MYAPICRENLKAITRAYAKATGKEVSAISKRFYGNSAFLEGFFAGDQRITTDKLDEIIEAFKKEWPPEARWPTLRIAVVRGPERRK